MSGRWWRAYDEAVDDPKLQQLPLELFRAWFNICCITSANGGVLPPLGDIAFKLRMKPDKVRHLVAELTAQRLIDETGGKLRPHNWDGRQFQSDNSTARVKRFRESKRNGEGNVSPSVASTVSETHQIQNRAEPEPDSDSEKKDLSSTSKIEINGHALSPDVAAVIKRATKKAERSNYLWLKPDDTRVPRARSWWLANYGSELPVQNRGAKSGYYVPWQAVQQ